MDAEYWLLWFVSQGIAPPQWVFDALYMEAQQQKTVH